VLQEDYVEISR